MASSVALGPALALDGPTVSAESWRQADGAALAYDQGTGGSVQARPGVYQGATRMGVQPGSGMKVGVNGGAAVIPSGVSSVNGAYRAALMQLVNLDVATSDPTNPRVDAVAVYINDLGTSGSTTVVQCFTGTPTSGANLTNLSGAAVPPAASSLILAYVLVPAGSTSVTSGNIRDMRTFTVAPGGILPLPSAGGSLPTGNFGQYAYDQANDRLFHLSATGPEQARTLPWAPQVAVRYTQVIVGIGVAVTVLTVSVTVDGSTDLDCSIMWPGMYSPPGGGDSPFGMQHQLWIAGSQVAMVKTWNEHADSEWRGGGTLRYVTSGAAGDTPSAGTKTIAYKVVATDFAGFLSADVSPPQPIQLYVKAATL